MPGACPRRAHRLPLPASLDRQLQDKRHRTVIPLRLLPLNGHHQEPTTDNPQDSTMVAYLLPLLTLGATFASAQIAATGSAATALLPATRISSSRGSAATATGSRQATPTQAGSASVTTSAEATASPSSTLPATAVLETYEPAEAQAWCPAGTYCSGDVSFSSRL